MFFSTNEHVNGQTSEQQFSRWFPYLLLLGIVINATGLGNEILDQDGALYATLSKNIILRNDWINLWGDGHDWLDKPHFPFWMAAISYKLFGITAFAYKFPAFIFWLFGLRFTYLLAKAIYNPLVAQIAVLIHALALHGILANFDVRAEPYLTMLCTGAIYYFYRSYVTGGWYYILFTAILAGCAIMTKGLFVLLTIGGGFLVYWMITRQWKQFLNYKWYVLLLLIGICMLPELYCLYVQFDQHPEKIVFGQTGVSGIRFFLWDSQFGRFLNSGPIKGNGDPSFFLHTTLWAFLPWALYLYVAVARLISKRMPVINPAEWIVYGSAGLTFLVFSLSKFQLPHYIIILFPQFAMITAGYLCSIHKNETWKRLIITQNILLIIVAAFVICVALFSKIGYSPIVFLITAILLALSFYSYRKKDLLLFLIKGICFAAILFSFLNLFFYPKLMHYQSGMMAAKFLKKKSDFRRAGMYGRFSYTFEFYAPGTVDYLHTLAGVDSFINDNGRIIYTTQQSLDEIKANGHRTSVLQLFPYYRVTLLTGKFLNPATRHQVTDTLLLAEIKD